MSRRGLFGRAESREAIDLEGLAADRGPSWTARGYGTAPPVDAPDPPDTADATDTADAADTTDRFDLAEIAAAGNAGDSGNVVANVEPGEGSDGPGHRERGQIVPRSQRRRRRGRALLMLLLVFGIPVAAAGAGVAWFEHRLDGAAGGQRLTVAIAPHTSTNQIANILEKKGVIDSTLAFRLYTRVFHHSKLHAGTFTLRTHMGVRAAVAALEKSTQPVRVVLRVRSGLWLSEIAAQVHEQMHLDPFEFLRLVKTGAVRSQYQPPGTTSLEGLLYPDTYYFTPQSTDLDVVRAMVRRFDEVAGSAGLAQAAKALGVSPYDAIKVAALIQTEAKFDADRPLVASAIYNRLAVHMPLQIDAMVLYANNTHSTKDFARLRLVDSPYNSYTQQGLGPTPIAAVTEVSLQAAEHPAHTTYIYWVNGDRAGHLAFATTQQEQDRNVDHARQLGLL